MSLRRQVAAFGLAAVLGAAVVVLLHQLERQLRDRVPR